uniref:45 kDa calcium-binding protein n=1 Tax=Astatotilapia calliptera TaxID=8154 RepID=A0AAX7W6B9_ASTCA
MAVWRKLWCRNLLAVSLLFYMLLHIIDVHARPANMSASKDKSPSSKDENEILPPDHLNGLKMELDGHLNKDFHQEVFLGKEIEEFDEDSEPRRNRKKLIEIFTKVDFNRDRSISAKEMQRWIMEKTEEHFQEAKKENKNSFRAVDPDGDGHVTWDEYRVKFLASKGFNEKEIAEKIKNNEDLKLDEETQEVLESLKDRWFQADNLPADQLLNEEEFLSFLHPEHSRGMLKYMVKEIVRDLGGSTAGPYRSQGMEELAQRVAEMAAAQREQAAEVRRQQEELQDQSERHLERIGELAALLWAWAPPPQVCPEDSEAVEEPREAPQQPEVADEARGDLRLPEEGEQPGEGLLLPGVVDEPLQPEAADEVREGLRRLEKEELHEGLLEPGVAAEGAVVTEASRYGLLQQGATAVTEGPRKE